MVQGSAAGRGATAGAPLRGRDVELAAIEGLITRAREGRGAGAIVLIGDAGLGTSALLERAAALADGMRVLRCVGAPTEVELPFAGLLQMLRPLLGLLARLPAPQAAALRGVFGLSPDRVEDRFLISVGALTLLGEAAEDEPLLCLIDDVGSLDHETVETLVFVTRRLEAERIGLLVALTEEEAARFALASVTAVRLSPLEVDDSLAAVRDVAGPDVSPSVAGRIVAAAGGVPLLLTELVASLSADQLRGREPLPVPLPVPAGVEELYRQRLRALSGATQTALLVAAATQFGEMKTVSAALTSLGVDEDALDAAARAGLVDVGDRVVFRHPAVRLAAYAGASSADRRRAHEALASVLVDAVDEDLRVWHRALATVGPDEGVAAELERSADRAAARSGCAGAASALERAAALSVDDAGRARRLARAAELAWLGGQSDRAMAFAGEAEALDRDRVIRARLDLVRAAWEAQHGVTSDAIPLLLQASSAVEDEDAETALRSLFSGVMVMSLVGRRPAPRDLERLGRLARRTPHGDALVALVTVQDWMAAGATTPAPMSPGDVASIVERVDDPLSAPFAIPTAAYLGDLGAARINGEVVVRRARARGAVAMLSFALRGLAGLEFWARRFDDARINAAEGLRLGLETGNENVAFVHHGILAAVAAARGDEATCREEAEAALLGAIERGNRDAIEWANFALGHLELSLGDPDAADRFEAVWAQPGIGEPRLIGAADAVEAAVRTERRPVAELRLAELERWTAHTHAPWALPLVARCRGLLATGEAAELHLEQALALHDAGGSAFDRARTELLLGELLRRDRRRADARPHLRAAAETFASVRAVIWEERARHELRTTGEVLRRRDPEAIWQLTPQELQIARIVARGASNRDAAAELFLSPRTVEYHLRKVFTKLGVSSRAELARMSLDAP